MKQDDEALRLLAQMYSRWFMRASVDSVIEDTFFQIRDALYGATSQQDAYAQLSHCAETISDRESVSWKTYERARMCVMQLIQAGGSADAIIVGQTDGYRHLCLMCSQDAQNFQRVPFFAMHNRRPLLTLEVGESNRSSYSTCQLCRQPLYPQKFVLLICGGMARHGKSCMCDRCNRAGTSYLVNIYECEQRTLQVIFPSLLQVAAPSRQKSVEWAIEQCWEHGWYMLNKETVLS